VNLVTGLPGQINTLDCKDQRYEHNMSGCGKEGIHWQTKETNERKPKASKRKVQGKLGQHIQKDKGDK